MVIGLCSFHCQVTHGLLVFDVSFHKLSNLCIAMARKWWAIQLRLLLATGNRKQAVEWCQF